MKMKRSTVSQWFYAVIICSTLPFTYLIGLFGGFNNGNPEGQNTVELFLPAGYAFAIWGVIYLGLFALGIWQGLPAQRENRRAQRAAPWLAVTGIGNIAWIIAASSVETVLWTIPALLLMQISAWLAYFELQIGRADLPQLEKRLHIPHQIYVGWLSVATIANSAAVLNVFGWSGWGVNAVTWTLIMLFVGTAVAWIVGWLVNQDNIYRAVFVWAFIAIFVAQRGTPAVAWAAFGCAIVVGLFIGYTLRRDLPRKGTASLVG